jgi:glycosyltransferase involved in cell wall biosynthesis
MMDKILLLAENNGIGGINSYLMLLAEGFKTNQIPFEIAVVWPKPDNWLQMQCASHDISLTNLASHRSITQLPRIIVRLNRLIHSKKFTLIHSQGYYSNILAKTIFVMSGRRIKLVTTLHGFPPDNMPFIIKLFIQLDWWTYHWSHIIIANSQDTSSRLVQKGVRFKRKKVILHGVVNQTQIEANRAIEVARKENSSNYVIGFVGRLSPEKGCIYLLEALSLLKKKGYNNKLLIVGDGPEMNNIKIKVIELGIENMVNFAGWQSNTAAYYSQMDIVVVPSLSESLGLTILEAMSYRKPVIATRVNGVPEIVHDGETGLLVPPASGFDIALAIERLIKDPNLCEYLGSQAQNYVFKYHTIDKMTADTLAAYREIQL